MSMKCFKLILVLIFYLFINPMIFSQIQNWKIFDCNNTDLPQSSYFRIVLDSADNKWISTSRGLVKVKDFNWTWYHTNNSGLPDNNLHDIAIDKYNRKWISSDSVLAVFNDTTWTVYNEKNTGFYRNYAGFLYIDNYGNIWMQGYGPTYKFNGLNWSKIDSPMYGLKKGSIYSMRQESNGTYWFGTDSGLVIIRIL